MTSDEAPPVDLTTLWAEAAARPRPACRWPHRNPHEWLVEHAVGQALHPFATGAAESSCRILVDGADVTLEDVDAPVARALLAVVPDPDLRSRMEGGPTLGGLLEAITDQPGTVRADVEIAGPASCGTGAFAGDVLVLARVPLPEFDHDPDHDWTEEEWDAWHAGGQDRAYAELDRLLAFRGLDHDSPPYVSRTGGDELWYRLHWT